MNLLRYLFRQSWGLMLITCVASILAGLSGTALVGVIGKTVSGLGTDTGRLGWLFMAFCLLYVLTKSCSDLALLNMTQKQVLALRVDLSKRILATSQEQLQKLGKADLHVILTKDIDAFIQAFQVLPVVLCGVVMIVGSLAYTAWLSWQVFAGFFCGLGISVTGYMLAARRPGRQLVEVREQTGKLHHEFRSLVDGSRELQLNAGRAQYFLDHVIGRHAEQYRRLFVMCMSRYAWILNVGNIMFYQGLGFILFILPHWAPQKPEVMITSALVLLYLIRPVSELIVAMPVLRSASVSLNKIEQLTNALQNEWRLPASRMAFNSGSEWLIELRDVRYQHCDNGGEPFMFGPVNLQIRQGEIVFIIGGNGSGKTTLAMLLLGLVEPSHGDILLRGTVIDGHNRDDYRQNFSVVFSDFHLFEFVLGPDAASLDATGNHLLEKFGLKGKARIVQGAFSTDRLSTGQRKRLALVSAYLEDRPIYVFDEWAADQDPAFKRIFYTEILPDLKSRGKTVVIISHDDAYFSQADRIIKLDSGTFLPASVDLAVA